MRECAIQLVNYSPSGDYLGELDKATCRAIADVAGGCTVLGDTVGLWRDDKGETHVDGGARVVVACAPEIVPELREIAAHYAREAGQACVYFVNGHTGEAEFIEPAEIDDDDDVPAWLIEARSQSLADTLAEGRA